MLEASQEQADDGDAQLSSSALGENAEITNQPMGLESSSAGGPTPIEAVTLPADLPAFPTLPEDDVEPDSESREKIVDAIKLEPATESASAGMRAFEQVTVAEIPGAEQPDSFDEATGLAMQEASQNRQSVLGAGREGMDIDADANLTLGRTTPYDDTAPREAPLGPSGDIQSDQAELELDDMAMDVKSETPRLADTLEGGLNLSKNGLLSRSAEPANQEFSLSGSSMGSAAGTKQATLPKSTSGIYIARSAAWTDDEVRWGLARATKLLGRPIVVEPALDQPQTSAVTPLNNSSGNSSYKAPVVIANLEEEEARVIIEKVIPELTGFKEPALVVNWLDQVTRDDPRQYLAGEKLGTQSGTALNATRGTDEVRPPAAIELIALFVTRGEAERVLRSANQRGAAWITNSSNSAADAEATAQAIVLFESAFKMKAVSKPD